MTIKKLLPGFIRKKLRELKTKQDFQLDLNRIELIKKSSIEDLKRIEYLEKLIPMGRLANKNEYKSAIKFLCTEDSSYMTGQNVIIDGGRSIW